MADRVNEAEIMLMLEPNIRSYCKWKWTCIEFEDRLSEARLVLLYVLRESGIPDEHIWPVFLRTLHVYMQPINHREGWHRYQCRSIDAHVRLQDGSNGRILHELLPDPRSDVYSAVEEGLDQLVS